MERITYYEVDPGGNRTAIVKGIFSSSDRKLIATKILDNNRSLEQVGFLMPARLPQAIARLEMAGGEFCGNATRCLASLLSQSGVFFLESSGLAEPIRVKASNINSTLYIPISYFQLKKYQCSLPGITHILLENSEPTKEYAKKILMKRMVSAPAAGVISYIKMRGSEYRIKPVVWVKDTKTLYEETACASGTAALAYFLWKRTEKKDFSVIQPSGAVLKTSIDDTFLSVDGPIRSIKKRAFEI